MKKIVFPAVLLMLILASCSIREMPESSDAAAQAKIEETVTSRLHPGAVILLHSVSPDNRDALGDIIDFARDNGYEFRALTEFGK